MVIYREEILILANTVNYNINKEIDKTKNIQNGTLNIATIFSGIGSIEHALKRMNINHKIVFACDNGDVDVLSKPIKDKTLENFEEELRTFKNLCQPSNSILLAEAKNIEKSEETIKNKCERLSMLFEKFNTIKIIQKLENIRCYKDKKTYVDKLYSKKEKSNKVKQSYLANYNVSEKDFHWNVSFLDGTQYKNTVDLFVGGSPCQSFSLVGKQRGLEDTRGTLFYEYARLISEIKPKVFIYENVKALLSNDKGETWKTIQNIFNNLNYTWSHKVLNSKDYGIPQNRERLFIVGFRNDLELDENFEFPIPITLNRTVKNFLLDNVSGKYYLPPKGVAFVTASKNLNKKYTQIDGDIAVCQKKNQQFNWHGDFVFEEEKKVNNIDGLEKYFLSEKVKKYVLSTGTKGFYSKPKIDLDIARPLLTTMHKMHRAGVDNYITTDGRLRKLTPRECLRLMGFCDSFNIVVSDTAMYQQAGNSIVVDVLIAIMNNIIKSYNFGGVSNEQY